MVPRRCGSGLAGRAPQAELTDHWQKGCETTVQLRNPGAEMKLNAYMRAPEDVDRLHRSTLMWTIGADTTIYPRGTKSPLGPVGPGATLMRKLGTAVWFPTRIGQGLRRSRYDGRAIQQFIGR